MRLIGDMLMAAFLICLTAGVFIVIFYFFIFIVPILMVALLIYVGALAIAEERDRL